MIIIKKRKRITDNQWIESTSIIKKSRYSNKNVKKENYVFTATKKDIKSRNTDLYKVKHRNQWKHKQE